MRYKLKTENNAKYSLTAVNGSRLYIGDRVSIQALVLLT